MKTKILSHPKVSKGDVDDVLWQEYDGWGTTLREMARPSWWVNLEGGFNHNGTSCIHAKSLSILLDILNNEVTEGKPY